MNFYTHQFSTQKLLQTFLFLFFCFLTSSSISGQIFWTEDFETEGNGTRYTTSNEFKDASNDYYGRVDGSSELVYIGGVACSGAISVIGTGGAYSGYNGNFFFAGEDMNDVGAPCGTPSGNVNRQITITNIPVNGITADITFTMKAAAGNTNPCGSNQYDNDPSIPGNRDYIAVHYTESYFTGQEPEVTNALCFNPDINCNLPGDVTNEPMFWDPNCDGDGGEGTLLNTTFQDFSFTYTPSAGAKFLALRIEMQCGAGSEELAIDHLRLSSTMSPVPVTLNSFNATKESKYVRLNWETSSEVNNEYFAIEHSTNGQDYQEVGRVDGNGNTADKISYGFIHDNPSQGTNFYRLHQFDFDGRSEYSDVRTVQFDRFTRAISVVPNPFNNTISIDLNQAFSQETEVNVYSMIGELVYAATIQADALNQNLDLSELATGAYILKVGNAENALTQRIVKY